jgi:hypothetical protein
MRLNHFALLGSFRSALASGVLGSLFALPQLAAAQAPTGGVMKQDAATSGKTDVASEGFASAAKNEHADDATEAKIQGGGLSASGNSRSLALTSQASVRVRREANELSAAAAANYGRSAAKSGDPMQNHDRELPGQAALRPLRHRPPGAVHIAVGSQGSLSRP